MGGILRVDPKTWVPEVLIRASSEEKPRLHDVCFDNEGNVGSSPATTAPVMGKAKPGSINTMGKPASC